MKKFITYIAIATALTAVSCSQDIATKDTPGEGKVTFQLFCTDPATRADDDDNYNEYLIDHFDYFFFQDAAGTQPVESCPHARVNGTTVTFATRTGEAFEALQEGGYVYIVANYPELIPADIQTLEQVLALPVSTDFQKGYSRKNPKGFIMDNLGVDGKLTHFQASSPEENPTVVRIGLSRLAVKTTLVINVVKQIAGSAGDTWEPEISNDHMFVYFVNADSTNTMAATPIRRAGESEAAQKAYFTYNTSHGYTNNGTKNINGVDYYQIVTDPSYTYPQSWNIGDNGEPYYKIQIGWNHIIPTGTDGTGDPIETLAPFYYKIPIPVAAENNVFTLNRNTWYQLTLNLKVLGGTEDEYVVIDKNYCVADFADWSSPSEDLGTVNDSAHYFDVPTLLYDIYSTNSVDISFICDQEATEGTLTGAVAEITEILYYDYSSNSATGYTEVKRNPANGTFAAARANYTYTHNGEQRTYSLVVDKNNKTVKFTHDITDFYVPVTIKVRIFKSTESAIYRDVTIIQHPAIELKKATDSNNNLIAGNVYVNGYFASVAGSEGGFGSTNNGGGYYHCTTGWSRDMSSDGSTVRGILHSTIGYGNISHISDIFWLGNNYTFFTTDISISAFSESNRSYNITVNGTPSGSVYYAIADPRIKASSAYTDWSLNPYLYNNNGSEATTGWQSSGDILVASTEDNARNKIAPHFLVSSGASEQKLTGTEHPTDYMSFVKRAATYQEAGFPAGRWRLPTEAEIAFIVARQNDGTIPDIFARDYTYYASSGRFVLIPESGTQMRFFTADHLDDRYDGTTYRAKIDAKFVYDLWYWGEEPMSANVYHPNMHIEN